MKNIVNEITKDVDRGTRYYLTITFGNGQIGNSTFKDVHGNYQTGAIVHTNIGTGAELEGKLILIGSIVSDVNPQTNWTSVTYSINGDSLATYKEEVEDDNGSIYYTTTIKFI